MDEREFEDAVQAHNAPPPVPRERMWARIDAERSARRKVVRPALRPKPSPWRRGLAAAAALAAVLAVGVGIGRWSAVPEPQGGPVAAVGEGAAPAPAATDLRNVEQQVYRLAAAQLFGKADFLLTDVKVRACSGDSAARVSRTAGGLLVQTRLLLDSPAAADAEMRALLRDLELTLAQIAGLSPDDCRRDLDWIKDGLERRDTLGRLRLAADGAARARSL